MQDCTFLEKWDLIYFNFGLNDVMYHDPATKQVRAMHKDAGGVILTSPEQYAKNLKELVKKFKATGAKLIWASTTPIIGNNGIHYAGDEIKYNKIAAKVMQANNVTIIDMHKIGLDSRKGMKGKGKTYEYKKAKPLHPPIIKVLVQELSKR